MNRIRFWIEVEADMEQGEDIGDLADSLTATVTWGYRESYYDRYLKARTKRDIIGRVIAESVDTNPAED